MRSAFILIDMQNDFMPGGALPVPHGNEIIPLANRLQQQFTTIIATQDWHPANHNSFAANHPGYTAGQTILWEGLSQILWPVHCVQHTPGAALVGGLETTRIDKIIYKGQHPDVDSYSAFFDNAHRRQTKLDSYLRQQQIEAIYLSGLATDYCVKYSALDGCALGYATHVIIDACRGIELKPGDIQQAIEEMQAKGIKIVETTEIL